MGDKTKTKQDRIKHVELEITWPGYDWYEIAGRSGVWDP